MRCCLLIQDIIAFTSHNDDVKSLRRHRVSFSLPIKGGTTIRDENGMLASTLSVIDAVSVGGDCYLMSAGCEAQAKLSAYHHGFVDAPVLATDGTPSLAATNIHQHLNAAFGMDPTASKPHLNIYRNKGIKWEIGLQVKLILAWVD